MNNYNINNNKKVININKFNKNDNEKKKITNNMHTINLIANNSNSNKLLYMKILPVYPNELLKFCMLSLLLFWIIFIFTMTRDIKDSLIVTNCGAEAIAFLKVYGVIPAATLFMLLYNKLTNTYDNRKIFYIILVPFLLFYNLFGFIIYPLRTYLHPSHIVTPNNGFSFIINLLKHWTFALYYVISELWGSAGVPLLFWTCANDVVKIDQVISTNRITTTGVYINIIVVIRLNEYILLLR